MTQRNEIFSIRIPRLLCLLSFNQLDCVIEGIYNLQTQYEAEFGPGNYIPPVAVVYWSFRIMVGIGVLLLALGLYAAFMIMGDSLQDRGLSLKIYILAIALPYISNTFGWIMAEIGRFPWIVYGLMKVDDGLSFTVPPFQMLLTLLGFTLVYAALIVATIYLMLKYIRVVPQAGGESPPDEDAGTPSIVMA